jgi:hypothetical protein
LPARTCNRKPLPGSGTAAWRGSCREGGGNRRATSCELARFLTAKVAEGAAIAIDVWRDYEGLDAVAYAHHAIDLSRSWGEADRHLPATHLVLGRVNRWLSGTHRGAVGAEYLERHLDEFIFCSNHRRAESPAHGFARVFRNAVRIPPATPREIVSAGATCGF